MASRIVISPPPMAPFPEAAWRAHMVPEEWAACLDAWILLAEAHLSFSIPDFHQVSAKDDSVIVFLFSYMSAAASSLNDASVGDPLKWNRLLKQCFLLSNRLFHAEQPPGNILRWEFLSDFCKVYGKTRSARAVSGLWSRSQIALEENLVAVKSVLVENLEIGINGNPKDLERNLRRLNHLIHSSPETATFLMNGSDFLDGLISCFKLMNPPLRKAIITTAYLSLIGLTEGSSPRFSLLTDQLYSLKAAADLHKDDVTSMNDCLVAELVTVTPILKQLQDLIESSEVSSGRAKSVTSYLEGFQKADGGRRKRLVTRNVDKGKGPAPKHDDYGHGSTGEMHVHRMSLITQVQDLFPDLGSRFIMKLLDEYEEDVEQVISHLLEDSLPSHLRSTNPREALFQKQQSESITALLPVRHNIFDGDEFDQLTVDTARLRFGRHDPYQTADDILRDRSTAPKKAAILSALAAFDSDDDERDDTYDVEDVGGTVDSATPGNNPEEANIDTNNSNEEALFRAFKLAPGVFGRDSATRRSKPRIALKEETGITDEAIEGWGLVLSRDPRRIRRLETKFPSFSGAQKEVAPTSWRAETGGSGTEESDGGGGGRSSRGTDRGQGGRGGRRRGGNGGGGNFAGPAGEKETEVARQRKEANKGSRANHNRRDQRARKMARAGFPA